MLSIISLLSIYYVKYVHFMIIDHLNINIYQYLSNSKYIYLYD